MICLQRNMIALKMHALIRPITNHTKLHLYKALFKILIFTNPYFTVVMLQMKKWICQGHGGKKDFLEKHFLGISDRQAATTVNFHPMLFEACYSYRIVYCWILHCFFRKSKPPCHLNDDWLWGTQPWKGSYISKARLFVQLKVQRYIFIKEQLSLELFFSFVVYG